MVSPTVMRADTQKQFGTCLYVPLHMYMIVHAVFFSKIIQSMMEGHGLGVAYGHIKVFGIHIKEKSTLKACRANNMP